MDDLSLIFSAPHRQARALRDETEQQPGFLHPGWNEIVQKLSHSAEAQTYETTSTTKRNFASKIFITLSIT